MEKRNIHRSQAQKEVRDDFLFGKNKELIIKRLGSRIDVQIGDRNLFGVTSIELKISANKPMEYCVRGEVLDTD